MVVAEKAVEGGREASRKMGTRAPPNLMSSFDNGFNLLKLPRKIQDYLPFDAWLKAMILLDPNLL